MCATLARATPADTVRRALEATLGSVQTNLAEISFQLDRSYSAISRQFKKRYSANVHTVALNLRMHEARRLLEGPPDLRVSDIAAKVGYGSSSSFARRFRAYWDMSPSQCRLQAAHKPTPESPESVEDSPNLSLIVLRNAARKCLLETSADTVHLPVIHIPANTRVAESISAAVRRRYGFDSLILFGLETAGKSRLYVLRALVGHGPDQADWRPIREAAAALPEADRELLSQGLARLAEYDSGLLPSRFCRFRWWDDLLNWVGCGPQEVTSVEHLNASEYFSLVRFVTSTAALWFKAVGSPNEREFGVMGFLGALGQPSAPRVVDVHREWRGWLMPHVNGCELNQTAALSQWADVFRELARLQIAALGRTDELLAVGARDRRLPQLQAGSVRLLEAMEPIMRAQPKEPPPRLTGPQLNLLADHLRELAKDLARTNVPDTLVHGDLNPGNVLLTEDGPVFLDWAEAYVGHPFLCAYNLLLFFRRWHPDGQDAECELQAAYAQPWRALLPESSIATAWRLIPPFTALMNALGGPTLAVSPDVTTRRASFLRSITRVIWREAAALREAVA
jgi:AraC-like DNA-binding protein